VAPAKAAAPPNFAAAERVDPVEAAGSSTDPGAPAPGRLEPATAPAAGTTSPAAPALIEADAALARDQLDVAQRHYEQALRLAPGEAAAHLGLLRVRWARLELPLAYAEAPLHPGVQKLVSDADGLLTRHPDYVPALLDQGRWLIVLGEPARARAVLERAERLGAQDPELPSALGTVWLASGDAERALRYFQRAVQLGPGQAERWTNFGTALMLRGRLSEAIQSYERALALQPEDARAAGDLGAAHLANHRPDLALPYLSKATQLAPERATFLTNLGYAYQLQGQLEKAVETQRRAVALDPKLGSAWINLGNALADLRQYEQAEAALRHAESLDPSDPRPKASLRDLAEVRAGVAVPPPAAPRKP
jgi:tetratricopeptide (TPR) repeat protein